MSDETPESATDTEPGQPIEVDVDEALQVAVSLHRDGRLQEAGAIYRGVLREIPEHPVALHFLGLLTHQRGDTESGLDLVRRAVAASPTYVDALNNLGNIQLQAGNLPQATEAYRRVIGLVPENSAAHNNLGAALKASGKLEEAHASYRLAVELAPGEADSQFNLATTLAELNRLDDAAARFRQVVEIGPGHAAAHFRLGSVLSALGRQEEALGAYGVAASLDSEHAATHRRMGHALMHGRIPSDAADAYRRALTLRPELDEAWVGLTKALYILKDLDGLSMVLTDWAEAAPDNPVPRHMLAGLSGEQAPPRASDAYVRETFDRFAASFDAQLEALDYRAPALISDVVSDCFAPEVGLEVLDAGCGTGLCGPVLRPFARRLIGVDLSPGMLERAGERAVYDALVEGELTTFLRSRPAVFDLIVAADTLVYFGALEEVLAAVAGSLRHGGPFVFTLELLAEAEGVPAYRLEPHGRYRHTRGYVERAAQGAGLRVRTLREEALRLEGGEPVSGLLIALS